MIGYKVTAFDLKLALLQYFRFERQWVCIDEFRGADVIVDTSQDIIEVEVKISRYDLEKGELKKQRKHHNYRTGRGFALCKPNKFYFCVPESLVVSAMGVCEKLNPRYGIIAFNLDVFLRHIGWNYKCPHRQCLRMARTGKRLHENYSNCQRVVAMRTSAKIITMMEDKFVRQQSIKGELK